MSLAAINRVKALKKEKKKRTKKRKTSVDFSKYADNPIGFAFEVLKIKVLTEEQKEIYISIRDNPTTDVQAGHGVGKSYGIAAIIIWWVFAVEGVAFTTAPTYDQVNDILWKEVRNLYDKNKKRLGGRRTELTLRKKIKGGVEVTAKGFSTKNYDSNSFQGKHHEKLLLVQDEADGISGIIDEAFDSCLSGSENRGVRIGNPLSPNSSFAKNCSKGSIKIPVWNHPNVAWAYEVVIDSATGKAIHRLKPEVAQKILKPNLQSERDPVKPQHEWDDDLPRDVIPGAVSIAWIEKNRLKYGEFSSFWMPRVEAEFPGDDVDGIIPKSWLKEARDRYDQDPDYWDNLAKQDRWRIGVDVSDGGDRHSIALWRGKVLYSVRYIQPQDDRQDTIRLATKEVAPLINSLQGMYGTAVDNVGVGAGTLGRLREMGYFAVGCKFGSSAKNKDEYDDRKIELFWLMREWLSDGEMAIAPLGDVEDEVFEEISAIRYTLVKDKKIRCETKEETKKRIKRSPDGADAVVTANEIETLNLTGNESGNSAAKNDHSQEDQRIAEMLQNAQQWQDDITEDEANKYFN